MRKLSKEAFVTMGVRSNCKNSLSNISTNLLHFRKNAVFLQQDN